MVNEPTNDVHVTNEQVIQEAQELAPRGLKDKKGQLFQVILLYIHLNMNVN